MLERRESNSMRTWIVAAACGLALGIGVSTAGAGEDEATADTPPDGVQQILPRGGIPAVFEPTFVSADEAEIDDDAWVLGVVIDGHARAYSLNLLNHHEVVNDRVGDHPFAAVW